MNTKKTDAELLSAFEEAKTKEEAEEIAEQLYKRELFFLEVTITRSISNDGLFKRMIEVSDDKVYNASKRIFSLNSENIYTTSDENGNDITTNNITRKFIAFSNAEHWVKVELDKIQEIVNRFKENWYIQKNAIKEKETIIITPIK